ncbi:MAG: dipeptidase [Gorillibacterium sp.]|nr:dipeptidase [Gorillibacterium sp.]
MMKVIDTHCDLLSRMLVDPAIRFNAEWSGADVSLPRLLRGDVRVQFYALYLSEALLDRGMSPILRMIELMHEKVMLTDQIVLIKSVTDLNQIEAKGQIGGILSLEGADGIGGNLENIERLFKLGVRFIGVTWNHANWAADGVMESRGGGFTDRGRAMIEECSRIGLILDVSHLSDRGFEELAERSSCPFIASHSNARKICNHPRNLSDQQIQTIIASGGRISLTFVPWFLADRQPNMTDLLRHIDHFCSLGGVKHIGFGSDYDGFADKIPGLTSPADYPELANLLLSYYKEEEVKGFISQNWWRFLQDNLPT